VGDTCAVEERVVEKVPMFKELQLAFPFDIHYVIILNGLTIVIDSSLP
jgi:hypothetical protein